MRHNRVKLTQEEENKRKAKMSARLAVLFALFNFALLGVIIFEVLQLF